MHRLALAPAVVLVALSGCLEPLPIEPGPSTGSWTETDAGPWFAHTESVGFCFAVCYAAAVVFDDGGTMWVTWGPMHEWDGGPGNITSGRSPTMRADDEPYREAVRDGFRLMKVDPYVRVFDVVTETIPGSDYQAIQERILRSANTATDPGRVVVDCEDCGSTRVVVYAERYWDVRLAPRDAPGVANEHPQEAWYRVHDQGQAIWQWIHQEGWTDPRW